jgi:hypothetical protein
MRALGARFDKFFGALRVVRASSRAPRRFAVDFIARVFLGGFSGAAIEI